MLGAANTGVPTDRCGTSHCGDESVVEEADTNCLNTLGTPCKITMVVNKCFHEGINTNEISEGISPVCFWGWRWHQSGKEGRRKVSGRGNNVCKGPFVYQGGKSRPCNLGVQRVTVSRV